MSDKSIFDDIEENLPSLTKSQEITDKALKAGWGDWIDRKLMIDKLAEEVEELRVEIEAENIDQKKAIDELGDVLIITANLAKYYGIDAEAALKAANNKLESRIRYVEKGVKALGKDLRTANREECDNLWCEAKAIEKKKA